MDGRGEKFFAPTVDTDETIDPDDAFNVAVRLVQFVLTMTIRISTVPCPIHPRWGRKQCYYIAIQPYHPTGSADRHRAVCVDRLVQRSLTARSNLGEFRDDPVVNAGQRLAYPGGPEACVPGPEQSSGSFAMIR